MVKLEGNTFDEIAFIRLVAEMRFAQKAYFKTRGQRELIEAKTLESKVDAEIRRICGPHN